MPPGLVQTVRGPVPPADLGVTLPHEHIRSQLWDRPAVAAVAYGGNYGEVNIDLDTRVAEVAAFGSVGGGTIVDLTLPGIGRDPELLREVSEATGVHVVMGCGWYREPYYEPQDLIDRRSVDQLTAVLVDECENGVAGTGIRPGVIGEIGSNNSWVSAQEERVHRAAARAAVQTGLAVSTHSPWTPVGLQQLDILTAEGLEPERIVIGHACSVPDPAYYHAVLERGAYLGFDNIGQWDIPGYQDRVTDLIVMLIGEGHTERLLLSHDVWAVRSFGFAGGTGFTHISRNYLSTLLDRGVAEEDLVTITVTNPARVLTGH